MILPLTLLLTFQLAGEAISRALGLPLPGPVLGMVLLLAAMIAVPKLADLLRPTAQGILAHLSLLFVPAGVGIIGHLDQLGRQGLPILIAIILSTALAIAVGALTFQTLAKRIEPPDA